MSKIIERIARRLSTKRAKIIDDFCVAYLATRWEDYFSKQKKLDFRRLELVIKQDGATTTYFCRLRKGKLPISSNPTK
jgi:hypothetical protein